MLSKWIKEYRNLTEKWQFISKLSAFLISIFTFFSIYDVFQFLHQNPKNAELQYIIEIGLLTAIIFQFSILVIFVSRFFLLFYKPKKIFWCSQGLWLFGLVFIVFYWINSISPKGDFGVYSTYSTIFAHASKSFDFFCMWYLILSPLRFLATFTTTLVKSKCLIQS